MKQNAHGSALASKSNSNLAQYCLATIAALMLFSAGPLPAADQSTNAPAFTPRIIVKLDESIARDIDAALPASLQLTRSTAHSRSAWLVKHDIRKMQPLFGHLVRQTKTRGISLQQLADETRRRFADRGRRAPAVPVPDLTQTYVLELAGTASDAEISAAVEKLNTDPEVLYAERERLVPLHYSPNDPYFWSSGTWGQAYQDLWGVHITACPTAWDTATGLGIVVAVVDTGVDWKHRDITNNIWMNADEVPNNGVDDDHNGFVDDVRGWDFAGEDWTLGIQDSNPTDVDGHGTHVAGTIAATGNNNLGVIGLAWGARIMPVRGYDNGADSTDGILANGVVYAANNGADVINNSYGGVGFSYALWEAMEYAHGVGAVVVASAGNDNNNTENHYPGSYPMVITIAASRPNDTKAVFSNYGSKIDVAAPGVDILSLRAAGTYAYNPVGTEYQRLQGTSMAAPHACGVAALILSAHPEYTPEQVRQALRVSADDLGIAGPDLYFGYGRVNAAAAIAVVDPLEAKILNPLEGGTVTAMSMLHVDAVAQGPGFVSYTLDCGPGDYPTAWTVLQQSTTPAGGQLVISTYPNLPDGRNRLRLRAFDNAGRVFTDQVSIQVNYVNIANPPPATDPSQASQFRPGDLVSMHGAIWGPTFSRFYVEWARGVNPTNGWSAAGITLAYGGTSTLYDEEFATWNTTGITESDYYTLRLVVENSGFTTEERVLVYLGGEIMSPYWPRYLYPIPAPGSSIVPARDAAGNTRLVMSAGYFWDPHPPIVISYAADGSENIRSEWLNNTAETQPAVADLDGNPGDEIVVGEGLNLRVLRPDLTTLTTLVPTQSLSFQKAQILIEDLNNDGEKEIIAVGDRTGNSFVYAWQLNGQQLTPNFPIPLNNQNQRLTGISTPRCIALDLNGDGVKEIVVAEGDGVYNWRLRAFNADGTIYTPWTIFSRTGYLVDIVAGDVDRDGSPDIALGYMEGEYEEGRVIILNADGTPRAGNWPFSLYMYEAPVLALADIDRDGKDEVVFSGNDWLYAARENGAYLLGTGCDDICNIAIGDIDADGLPEILAEKYEYPLGYQLAAFQYDGRMVKSWPILGMNGLSVAPGAVPLIGDFNNDGKTDLIAWYRLDTSGTGEGVIMAVTPRAGLGSQVLDWPMNSHDPRNTRVSVPPTGVPTIVITEPSTNLAVLCGVTLFTAEADDDTGVAGVQFRIDNANIGPEIEAAPYSMTWDTSTAIDGRHKLTAIARDSEGHLRFTNLTVYVSNDRVPPAVAITYPTNDATVSGTVAITATATDNIGIAAVQFRVDGANISYEDGYPPYNAYWNTATVPNGPHALTAVARDVSGNCTTSTVVNVIVNSAPDTNPPSVTISSHANGAQVSGTITVTATAMDNVGVAGVQFRLDSATLGAEDTAFPYSVSWDTTTAANGAHTLSAVARDAAGNRATNTINITVNNDLVPPTVSITTPANGALVSGIINIAANASDNAGVTGVQFLIDDTNLGAEDTAAPYSAAWDTATAGLGSHTLAAVARDAAGNRATNTISVTVTTDSTPPTVSVTSPANNARVGGTVTVTANASDNLGVAGVQFQLDGANLGAEDTVSPYSLSWDTTTAPVGAHALRAIARDAVGNVSTSAVVNVTVTNVIRINFQPTAAPVYAGYAVDGGAVYGPRGGNYSYGWNLNNSSHAYDRNSTRSADQRYDTLITMQVGGTYTWEIGVPNGSYSVHVVAGDPNYYNSVYRINVEGVLTVSGTPRSSSRWIQGTRTVTVADGRLTVSNGAGASNNKICFLEITPLL